MSIEEWVRTDRGQPSILRFDSPYLVVTNTAIFSARGPEFLEVGGVGGY